MMCCIAGGTCMAALAALIFGTGLVELLLRGVEFVYLLVVHKKLVLVCMCVCVRARVCVCVHACMHACMYVYV